MIARLMGLQTMAPEELHQHMRAGPVAVLDTNARRSWIKARVPGSTNIDPGHYAQSALPQDRNALLVFYCSGPFCRKAPHAARRAKTLGYRNVRVMSAGIQGWIAAGLPIERDELQSAS
jgi:rhodanese-related sulfurtransferase